MDPKRNEKYMSSEEINSYFSFTFWYTRVSSDIFYFLGISNLWAEAGILSLEIQDMIEIQLLVYRKRSEKKQ